MNDILIPEVVKNTDVNKNRNLQQLNINLKKNINTSNYDVNQYFNTVNNNQTINNNNYQNKTGLFSLLFGLVSFPFTLIIKATKYIFTKYDLKNKLKIEQINRKKEKVMLKYLKSTNSVYDFDEIL